MRIYLSTLLSSPQASSPRNFGHVDRLIEMTKLVQGRIAILQSRFKTESDSKTKDCRAVLSHWLIKLPIGRILDCDCAEVFHLALFWATIRKCLRRKHNERFPTFLMLVNHFHSQNRNENQKVANRL